MKIANKMKEITKNKGLIINDYQKREHIDILSDDEIRKIIREKRKEEINKISQETREKIKQLKKEKSPRTGGFFDTKKRPPIRRALL